MQIHGVSLTSKLLSNTYHGGLRMCDGVDMEWTWGGGLLWGIRMAVSQWHCSRQQLDPSSLREQAKPILAGRERTSYLRERGWLFEVKSLMIAGQGSWYALTHRPDKIIATAPLSGYSSIQSKLPTIHLIVDEADGKQNMSPTNSGSLLTRAAWLSSVLH